MASFWQRLNFLVPEPQCRTKETKDGKFIIFNWKDSRPQPSKAAILAVTDQQAEDASRNSDKDFIDSELAKSNGNALKILKALRKLRRI